VALTLRGFRVRHTLRSALPALALLLAATSARAGLSQSFQQVGHLGLEVAAAPGGNLLISSGTLTLSTLPASASVVRARLYTGQVNNGTGLDAIFAGTSLGSVTPAASDGTGLRFYTYAWDVTGLVVPGVNTYSFTIGQKTSGGGTVPGVALAVVWEDALEPTRQVTIVDGMKQVGETGAETESATFTGLGEGGTTVWTFTTWDDHVNTGEAVTYNGIPIGGPIDANLGVMASLLRMNTTSVNGTNTLSISTNLDTMGWLLAATAVTAPPLAVTTVTWQQVKALYR